MKTSVSQFANKEQQETHVLVQNSKWKEEFVEEVREVQEGQVTEATYEELVKQKIDFGMYSTVVDEFFALLEA